MPINESAIAAAAYAAGHNRSKDCPLLGQIAHGALMEFLASKAQGSIASGPYPSNEVVMGKRVAEGQSGDRESKKNTDTMNDESNIRTNALGDLKPYVSPSQSVLQGVEENEVEIPVEDHHENRAESKISSSGVKTEDYEAKILENGQPELKIAADVRYPHDEENDVVKDPKEEVQNATISIEGVHAGKMEDLKDMEVKDLMEDENYDGVEVFQICEGAGANSSSESFQMINDNAHDILKNSDTDKEKTSTATTNISVLILHIAATALQSNNENELPRRFDKCSTSSHAGAWGTTSFKESAGAWGTTSFKDPVGAWGDTRFKDPGIWGTSCDEVMRSKVWKPFKYSGYPHLNDIPAGRSIMVF